MSRCWTTSLPCTHRLQRRLQEWHSRAFPCSPEPPRSARKLTRSSKRSSFVPPLFKVSGKTLCCGAVVAVGWKWEAVICSKLRKCRRPRCACRTELLHQMEVRNEVRHVQTVWFSSRSCWNRWQHLTCPGCSLRLAAQPVFPPKLNVPAFRRKQWAEEPDLSENKKVSCWVLCARSEYLVASPAAAVQFASSKLSQIANQWGQREPGSVHPVHAWSGLCSYGGLYMNRELVVEGLNFELKSQAM